MVTSEEIQEQTGLTRSALFKRLEKGLTVQIGTSNEALLAERFVEGELGGDEAVVSYQKSIYAYDPKVQHYVELTELHGDVRKYAEQLYESQVESVRELCPEHAQQIQPRNIRQPFIADVVASVHANHSLFEGTPVPGWIDGRATEKHFIPLQNGLFDVDVFLRTDKAVVIPHTPKFFGFFTLPFRLRVGASCPRWLEFLDRVLEGDMERIALLQEWAGYLLVPDARYHKFLVLEGLGGNGKGVVVDVLVGLIGEEAVSSLSLEGFGSRFGTVATFGKLLNVSSEATRLNARLEDCLKRYTGGDRFTSDRKNQSALQWKPTARLMILTNARPVVEDESDGFWRRMMVLPFRVQIPPEEQNPNLAAELIAEEVEGIFWWALQGLKRLSEREAFTVPSLSAQTKAEYQKQSSPVTRFVDEQCVLDSRAEVPTKELYAAYARWAVDAGEVSLSAEQFGTSLTKVCRAVRKHRLTSGTRPYVYRGISLIDAQASERKSRLPFRRSA